MPEGNEIHRWAERHETAFGGRPVRVDGPQGRFTDSEVIDGRKLQRVRAVGKHLGYDFGKDRILHIHMGMRGDFTEGSGALPEVRGALRLRMWNAATVKTTAAAGEGSIGEGSGKAKKAEPGETMRRVRYADDDGTGQLAPERLAWVELRGPTDCSLYSEAKWKELLERLGPDPLNTGQHEGKDGDDSERVIARIGKSKKPMAALLMDQSVIAGLGNIFRAELLYRARLSPFVAGQAVPEQTIRAIWKDAGTLMRAGMVDRRIVTTRSEDRPSHQQSAASEDGRSHSGKAAKGVVAKDEVHYVYRRNGQPCFVCGTKVMRKEMEGRNLYWCPVCQAE
jgi:endonuclease VIII